MCYWYQCVDGITWNVIYLPMYDWFRPKNVLFSPEYEWYGMELVMLQVYVWDSLEDDIVNSA
jgi:hypothetical protein